MPEVMLSEFRADPRETELMDVLSYTSTDPIFAQPASENVEIRPSSVFKNLAHRQTR